MKPTKITGAFTLKDQQEMDELYTVLLQKLYGLTSMSVRIMNYAAGASKIDRYTPLQINKLKKELAVSSKTTIHNALKQLEQLGILQPSDYKELYVIDESKMPAAFVGTALKIDVVVGVGMTTDNKVPTIQKEKEPAN